MIEYRIRTGFRIAALFPALAFCAMGVALVVVSYRAMLAGKALEGFAILIGLAVCALGLGFLRLAWTGRVPAFVEEYGLDDPGEIELFRAKARQEGRLYE